MTASGCPIGHDAARPGTASATDRFIERPGETLEPALERIDGVWHVRSYALGRELLRVPDGLRQGGFNADFIVQQLRRMRLPILYGFGQTHRQQRAAVARYFAPRTIDEQYDHVMRSAAARLVDGMRRDGTSDFTVSAYAFSVEVAAFILGLDTRDLAGLSKRLHAMFSQPIVEDPALLTKRQAFAINARGQLPVLWFWLRDVGPAIRRRRRQREADVISHLIDNGYSSLEIVTECVTYAAAGMVTTREFLQVALWHLLRDDELLARFRAGDSAARRSLLLEILRLEPVVGRLSRTATEDVTVATGGEQVTIAQGERVLLYIRATNVDMAAFGDDATRLCPGRATSSGTRPEGLGFGEGAHRCPGNALAIAEAEILLGHLLDDNDVELVGEPELGWEEIVAGYTLSGLSINVRPRQVDVATTG